MSGEYFLFIIIPHWKFPKALYQSGCYLVRSHCYITRYLSETTNGLLLAVILPVTSLSLSSGHF